MYCYKPSKQYSSRDTVPLNVLACDPPEDPGFPHDGAGDDDPGLPCGGVHDHQAVVHVPDVIKFYSDKCMFFS
jgi:hypothetical protein